METTELNLPGIVNGHVVDLIRLLVVLLAKVGYPQRAKKASAGGRSPPQELEVKPA